MNEFASWYIKFIQDLGDHLLSFFRGFLNFFAEFFYYNPKQYIDSFFVYSSTFSALDWIFGLIIVLINISFIVFLISLLFVYFRRYVKFVKNDLNKEELVDEIIELNQIIMNVTDEKNKILSLKAEDLGLSTRSVSNFIDDENEDGLSADESRFSKLITVDQTYNYKILPTQMKDTDKMDLKALTTRFINFAASQLKLYYSEKTVGLFLAGMASSKLIILEGISGTGKTSLPYSMGKFFKNDTSIISVQPSWRDRSEMIGYLNEFTKKFNETDFLKSVYEATYRTDMNLIVLDEMNLARVEYYFADFLSLMEMPNPNEWLIDVVPSSQSNDPARLKDGKILIPQNVWFIGTANRDDSTFAITDKVYDRASSIELNTRADFIDAPMTEPVSMSYEYLSQVFKEAVRDNTISIPTLNKLDELDEFITQKFQITFGNRIFKQIGIFVPVFMATGGDELTGLDYIFNRKVLRKFETLNLPFLQEELAELDELLDTLFGEGNFPETKAYLTTLRRQI